MPVIENRTSGTPDEIAVTIAKLITADPNEFLTEIQHNLEFCLFIWNCLFHLIEDVGYVPQPCGNDTKKIVCYVPLGNVNDPVIDIQAAESLAFALRSYHWKAEVEQRGKKLFFKLSGILSASDVPVLDKRCVLPSPVQFSHLMRPENEALTRLIWSFGNNILRKKRTFSLGARPELWLAKEVLQKGITVYLARGWNVRPWEAFVAGRKTHYLNFTLPPQKALPAPGKAS